jgi:hypothetical protein
MKLVNVTRARILNKVANIVAERIAKASTMDVEIQLTGN